MRRRRLHHLSRLIRSVRKCTSNCSEIAEEAKEYGLAVVVWSYPRGSGISKEGETAIDVVAYAAQIAAQLGANIVKVKLPGASRMAEAKKVYEAKGFPRRRWLSASAMSYKAASTAAAS